MQQKIFYKTLVEVSLYPNKIKQVLLDKRLTNIEKKILESYLLIRNNHNSQALELLKGLPRSEFPFVEAQRQLLLGISFNNQSHFNDAEKAIWLSIPTFEKLESHYFLFLAYFNLCFIYFNKRQLPEMQNMISIMESIPLESDLQETRLLRCKFNYYSEINDRAMALEILKVIVPKKLSMPESDIISQLVFEFMFFVKEENFSMCRKVLGEMKKFRKFHLSANFNYMKKLLDHLTNGTPIYAYHEEFENMPILFHQIKMIQGLEEKNLEIAESHWSILKSSLPNIYHDYFEFMGEKCLFSLCLQQHQRTRFSILQFKIPEGTPRVEVIISLLTQSKEPLPAGLIYEIIWGRPPASKEDLNKISRLVYQAKIECRVEIEYRKGTYAIKTDKKEASKIS